MSSPVLRLFQSATERSAHSFYSTWAKIKMATTRQFYRSWATTWCLPIFCMSYKKQNEGIIKLSLGCNVDNLKHPTSDLMLLTHSVPSSKRKDKRFNYQDYILLDCAAWTWKRQKVCQTSNHFISPRIVGKWIFVWPVPVKSVEIRQWIIIRTSEGQCHSLCKYPSAGHKRPKCSKFLLQRKLLETKIDFFIVQKWKKGKKKTRIF